MSATSDDHNVLDTAPLLFGDPNLVLFNGFGDTDTRAQTVGDGGYVGRHRAEAA